MELRMEGICKNFKDKNVLQEINIKIENGLYGLLGPNGAGKTTLMRILADILEPNKGKVFINGKDKSTCGDEYRSKIGYLPQEISYYSDFTGLDYLQYVSALKGLSKEQAHNKIDELACGVGLQDDLFRKVITYSGGMKQRLGIAQALLNEPEILILDEPTAGLDPHERIKFRNIISVFSKDRLVLLSTHIVSDVDSIAKQIMMIGNGKIENNTTAEEYMKSMEGRVWIFELPIDKLVEFQKKAVISNAVPRGDRIEVRVIDEKKPSDDAVPASPNMEDAYLYVFNYLAGRSA